jgi:hypothetical protein
MKKYQLLLWFLLLPLFIYAQRRSGKESPQSLGISFAVNVIPNRFSVNYLPLTFQYEYTKRKNTYSIGLQLSYGYQNFEDKNRDSTYILCRCNNTKVIGAFSTYGGFFTYERKEDYFNTNIPIFYRRTFTNVLSDFEFFAQAGLIFNFNIWYKKRTLYPLLDNTKLNMTCKIIDLTPQEFIETSKSILTPGFDATLGGGLKYKISNHQSLFCILQYQHTFGNFSDKLNSVPNLYLYLGYSFTI